MSNPEDAEMVVVRDNTWVMVVMLLIMFVTMTLLTVCLVRLGNISRKLDGVSPPQPPPVFQGGGGRRYDQYFYVP